MGEVTVPVNGRSFAITCDDGQEPRIRRLAQYVDAKVAEFVSSMRKTVLEYCGGRPHDDMTMLVLRAGDPPLPDRGTL